jgi:hypothetical protein
VSGQERVTDKNDLVVVVGLKVERIPRGVKVRRGVWISLCDKVLIQFHVQYVDSVKKASFEGLRIGVPRQVSHLSSFINLMHNAD